ncbi:MAG: hypothetical protein OSB23_00200 [Porticoccaceae bacterium]|nr:hypothetical protein [Porticoccaceae bacterium]
MKRLLWLVGSDIDDLSPRLGFRITGIKDCDAHHKNHKKTA